MYTPETVQAVARAMQTDDAPHYAADAAHMLEDYAATLKAAQGGVTDQTLREMCRAYETTAHGFADFTPNERGLQAMRAALEAALSAEPAAQGEAVGWIDEFGNVYPLGAHSLNGKLSWQDAHKRSWRPLYTAPPAQPAERVPEAWVPVPREALGYVSDLLAERKYGTPGRSPAHNARVVVDYWLAATPAAPADGDGKEGVL